MKLTICHTMPDTRCRHRCYDYDSEISNSSGQITLWHTENVRKERNSITVELIDNTRTKITVKQW